MEMHEAAVADELDRLAGKPDTGLVGDLGKGHGATLRHAPRGRWLCGGGVGGGTLEHDARRCCGGEAEPLRSEEHTSELQSLMRNSYAVFCLKKKTHKKITHNQKPR